jgi:hypothetical protein
MRYLVILLMVVFAGSAIAGGAGKAPEELDVTAEEQAMARAEKAKAKEQKKAEAMAKHAGKKADKERKEMGKGSEQGQAKREENSKKWWKFWED